MYICIILAKEIRSFISDDIKNKDCHLFNRITEDTGRVLYDLLPPKCNGLLKIGAMTSYSLERKLNGLWVFV